MSNSRINIDLDLLQFSDSLKITSEAGLKKIWDPVRRKYFVLQPEEHVRQLWIAFLIHQGWSKNLISVEKQIIIGEQIKRYDLLVFKSINDPLILIECKNPGIDIDQKTFDQISLYNINLKIPFLVVTNGRTSYACRIDFEQKNYTFIDYIPRPHKTNDE